MPGQNPKVQQSKKKKSRKISKIYTQWQLAGAALLQHVVSPMGLGVVYFVTQHRDSIGKCQAKCWWQDSSRRQSDELTTRARAIECSVEYVKYVVSLSYLRSAAYTRKKKEMAQ